MDTETTYKHPSDLEQYEDHLYMYICIKLNILPEGFKYLKEDTKLTQGIFTYWREQLDLTEYTENLFFDMIKHFGIKKSIKLITDERVIIYNRKSIPKNCLFIKVLKDVYNINKIFFDKL